MIDGDMFYFPGLIRLFVVLVCFDYLLVLCVFVFVVWRLV